MKILKSAAIAAAITTAAMAAPASAATTEVPPLVGCSTAPLTPSATSCYGYFDNNQFSQANSANQQTAINALIGAGNYTVNWTNLVNAGLVVSGSNVAAFNQLLANASGQVILGIHWGNVPESGNVPYGNVSAVYLFDNVKAGSIQLTNTQGYSNAVLYRATGAVPEPSTWALMLLGFGAVGVGMRRRRRHGGALLPQVA